MRDYTVSQMGTIMKDFVLIDTHLYEEFRDLLVCRITLLNTRRGGEPSRLRLVDMKDAEIIAWITTEEIDKLDNPSSISDWQR